MNDYNHATGIINLTSRQLNNMLDVIEKADIALNDPSPHNVAAFEEALKQCDDIRFSEICPDN